MDNPVHMIIYDRSNYDSLICAAIQKYYILHPDNENNNEELNEEVVALNWDEIPYTRDTNISTIRSECKTISLCAAIIDVNIIRLMYNAIGVDFLSIQSNPLYKDIVAGINPTINQLFKQRKEYSQLAEDVILCVGQSASLTLFEYIYKDQRVPHFYRYIDSFVTDSYYDHNVLEGMGLSRDEVIKFEKGLTKLYGNDFDELYNILIEPNGPDGIEDHVARSIVDEGEGLFESTQNYIIDHYKKYKGVIWKGNNKEGITRKVLPIFTSEKLSTTILLNPIFDIYDSIVTFNQLNTGYWEMCLYNIIHDVDVEDFNNLTIEQIRTMRLNTFSAGIYMKNIYLGMGNDIYGYALINDAKMCKIISLKEI